MLDCRKFLEDCLILFPSSSDYDEEELDALDTVVVDPLSANANNGPTLNWGWGQPVRTQSREDTQQQHRNHRSLQNTMSLMGESFGV